MFNPPVQRKSSQGVITALSIGRPAAPNVAAQIDAIFSLFAALGIERTVVRERVRVPTVQTELLFINLHATPPQKFPLPGLYVAPERQASAASLPWVGADVGPVASRGRVLRQGSPASFPVCARVWTGNPGVSNFTDMA